MRFPTFLFPAMVLSWLILPCLAVAQPYPHYVIRLVQTEEKPEGAAMERIAQTVLTDIDKSNRIDVLPATSTNGAATHLGEATVTYWVPENSITIKSFNDSLSEVQFYLMYRVAGGLNLLLTEVETGRIASSHSIMAKGEAGTDFKFKYKELDWSKAVDKKDEKLRAAMIQKARGLIAGKFSEIPTIAFNSLIGNLHSQTRATLINMFPYRLKVLEATEIDKDDAEKVQIEGGQVFDLSKGDRLVVYTVQEVKANNRSFERFEVVGRLKYESDNDKGGICDVSKGKDDILKALKSGQPLWCREGGSPYTLRSSTEDVRIAVGSFITPTTATPQTRELLYRRLRAQILARKGFIPLEREKIAALQTEKDLQKKEEFMDNAAIEQYKSVGADLILEVKIADPVVDAKVDYMTNKTTSASVITSYTLRLIDVATGEVLNERAGRTSKSYGTSSTGEVDPVMAKYQRDPKSVSFSQEGLAATTFDVIAALNEAFPPRILVSEITDSKKERAEDVLLVGEINDQGGGKYFVMRKRMVEVDGQQLPHFEQIGLVALRESEGDGIVNAKVKEGGKEIFAAMKAGEEIFCVDRPNVLDRLSKWGNNRMERYGY